VDHLNRLISENLKRVRAEKGLSLDAVAKASGVSKSMLGQIERGEVNPTVSTMWRIANGLKVSFTSLMTRPHDDTEVVSRAGLQPLFEDGGKVRNYTIFPFDADRGFEIYVVEWDAGGYLHADAHPAGTQEYITLHTGQLVIRVGDEEHLLGAGDSIRFKADQPHAYHNPGESTGTMTMVIHYPRVP
jgi:XRE family transcriptional regulator, regulator of sulfur utilization